MVVTPLRAGGGWAAACACGLVEASGGISTKAMVTGSDDACLSPRRMTTPQIDIPRVRFRQSAGRSAGAGWLERHGALERAREGVEARVPATDAQIPSCYSSCRWHGRHWVGRRQVAR